MNSTMIAIFAMSNLAIVLGYVFVGTNIAPKVITTNLKTKIGGIAFFFLCAITHGHLFFHSALGISITPEDYANPIGVTVHVLQAVSVWVFASGIWDEHFRGKSKKELDAMFAEAEKIYKP